MGLALATLSAVVVSRDCAETNACPAPAHNAVRGIASFLPITAHHPPRTARRLERPAASQLPGKSEREVAAVRAVQRGRARNSNDGELERQLKLTRHCYRVASTSQNTSRAEEHRRGRGAPLPSAVTRCAVHTRTLVTVMFMSGSCIVPRSRSYAWHRTRWLEHWIRHKRASGFYIASHSHHKRTHA